MIELLTLVNILLVGINVIILGLSLKLYTEILKDKSIWCRTDVTRDGMFSKHHPNCPKNKLIKIFTITPGQGLAPCTERNPEMIKPWLEDANPGDVMQIVVGEIEEWKWDEMPEYMGP